jgi:hypothetical protein
MSERETDPRRGIACAEPEAAAAEAEAAEAEAAEEDE